MEHSPSSEANMSSASQEIPRVLWNPTVHYRAYNSPASCPYPEPDQSSPFPLSHLLIHLNIILQCMPASSKWSPSLRSPHQNLVGTSCPPPPKLAIYPDHLILLFDHPSNTWWAVEIIKLLVQRKITVLVDSVFKLHCTIVRTCFNLAEQSVLLQYTILITCLCTVCQSPRSLNLAA